MTSKESFILHEKGFFVAKGILLCAVCYLVVMLVVVSSISISSSSSHPPPCSLSYPYSLLPIESTLESSVSAFALVQSHTYSHSLLERVSLLFTQPLTRNYSRTKFKFPIQIDTRYKCKENMKRRRREESLSRCLPSLLQMCLLMALSGRLSSDSPVAFVQLLPMPFGRPKSAGLFSSSLLC